MNESFSLVFLWLCRSPVSLQTLIILVVKKSERKVSASRYFLNVFTSSRTRFSSVVTTGHLGVRGLSVAKVVQEVLALACGRVLVLVISWIVQAKKATA